MEDFIWPAVQFTFAMLFGIGCYYKGQEVGWVAGYARGRRDAAYAAIDPNPDEENELTLSPLPFCAVCHCPTSERICKQCLSIPAMKRMF